jgi:electron transport complex protein RnfB
MTNSQNISLVEQIDQCLPQTQCTLCTYPRCREYAEALVDGEASINQCPPGGDVTISLLSNLLETAEIPLNSDHGINEPKIIAFIREQECIGCKLCIKACPVDCIIGGPKLMHTVIANDCTGCKLCLPVCPTDCIDLVSPPPLDRDTESQWNGYGQRQVMRARENTEHKIIRIEKKNKEKKKLKRTKEREQMQFEIRQALERKKSTQK